MSQSLNWVVYNIDWSLGNIKSKTPKSEKIKVTSRRVGEMGPGAS